MRPNRASAPRPCPDRALGTGGSDRAAVPCPIWGTGAGHGPRGVSVRKPCPRRICPVQPLRTSSGQGQKESDRGEAAFARTCLA
jgi:hypothetical protein